MAGASKSICDLSNTLIKRFSLQSHVIFLKPTYSASTSAAHATAATMNSSSSAFGNFAQAQTNPPSQAGVFNAALALSIANASLKPKSSSSSSSAQEQQRSDIVGKFQSLEYSVRTKIQPRTCIVLSFHMYDQYFLRKHSHCDSFAWPSTTSFCLTSCKQNASRTSNSSRNSHIQQVPLRPPPHARWGSPLAVWLGKARAPLPSRTHYCKQ